MSDNGGYLLYKCRNCGKIDKSIVAPELMTGMRIALGHQDMPEHWIGIPPREVIFHSCSKTNIGVADLVGGEYIDE